MYDGNINRTKQNDASSVHHLIILMLQRRMSKDKEFTGSKTIKQNTKMKKRIFGAALLVAIAVATGWNYQQNINEVEFSELTIANIEALARNESGGIFPACQKNKGSGDYAYIPFCVKYFNTLS